LIIALKELWLAGLKYLNYQKIIGVNTLIKLKKGLNLPINGEPEQAVFDANPVKKVALMGPDYTGMKPDFAVSVGDTVKLGQLLFTDKKKPAIRYTAPGAGKVVEINRGEKRAFLSIVIELDGKDEINFQSFPDDKIKVLKRDAVIAQLLESGLWTAMRARPFGKIADPETKPHSIFITAIDTNPLAPSVEMIISEKSDLFKTGLKIILKLTDGQLFVCKAPGTAIPVLVGRNLVVAEFQGPHPAGNVGTHIHFLDPVSRSKTVWHIGAQDIIAIGHLFKTGRLRTDRVIALAGPLALKPRLIRTRLGASLQDLTVNELKDGERRIISGSVFSGYTANGSLAFLGRYHQQVTILPEDKERKLFGWLSPGANLFSVKNVVLSKMKPWKTFDFSTSMHGGVRGIVPIGSYEKVMPLDILSTYLLRALAVDDIDEAEKLGCLELDEEDLSLCTFVCPSKIEHGQNLRRVLTLIEKEG